MKRRPKTSRETEDGLNPIPHQKKLRYLKTRRQVRKLQITLVRTRALARFFATILICWGLIKLVNLPQWYLNANIFNY